MPKIIYSALISAVLKFLLTKLALSEGLILDFKGNRKTKDINKIEASLKKNITIKFVFYYF